MDGKASKVRRMWKVCWWSYVGLDLINFDNQSGSHPFASQLRQTDRSLFQPQVPASSGQSKARSMLQVDVFFALILLGSSDLQKKNNWTEGMNRLFMEICFSAIWSTNLFCATWKLCQSDQIIGHTIEEITQTRHETWSNETARAKRTYTDINKNMVTIGAQSSGIV